MKDTELYQQLLGLRAPWFVRRVGTARGYVANLFNLFSWTG